MRFPTPVFAPRFLITSVFALTLTGEVAAQTPSAGDAARGKIFFQQSCAVCHATGQEPAGAPVTAGQGPSLAGVVGRTAGTLTTFGYTPALVASHLTWDAANLDRFLTNPPAAVPGTNMVIPVPSAVDRANL